MRRVILSPRPTLNKPRPYIQIPAGGRIPLGMCTPSNTRLPIASRLLMPLAAVAFCLFATGGFCQTDGGVQMKVTSTLFNEGGPIPKQCTADGANTSPDLKFTGVPAAAKSLVLVVDDPDAPKGTLTHWLMWNLLPGPGGSLEIVANSPPQDAVQGLNFQGKNAYTGPNPPSGTHRYHFRLFALDIALKLPPHSGRKAVDNAMEGHVLAKAELVGLYSRGAGKY
jgi:Raf kinase inhibitor-like YbhB/YbcL family protein